MCLVFVDRFRKAYLYLHRQGRGKDKHEKYYIPCINRYLIMNNLYYVCVKMQE